MVNSWGDRRRYDPAQSRQARGSSMLKRFLVNYALRHQHPANQLLHVIGLPVTFLLPWWFLHLGWPWAALAAFAAGYAMQFAGHAIEGNDAGEAILVKKSLGWPYIDIVDHANESSADD